jgi:hypothetical protein
MIQSLPARALLILMLLVPAFPASADAPRALPLPPPDREAVSMQSWGLKNRDCDEWTNACQICRRGADGRMACSTPGIACQPEAIICRARKAQ